MEPLHERTDERCCGAVCSDEENCLYRSFTGRGGSQLDDEAPPLDHFLQLRLRTGDVEGTGGREEQLRGRLERGSFDGEIHFYTYDKQPGHFDRPHTVDIDDVLGPGVNKLKWTDPGEHHEIGRGNPDDGSEEFPDSTGREDVVGGYKHWRGPKNTFVRLDEEKHSRIVPEGFTHREYVKHLRDDYVTIRDEVDPRWSVRRKRSDLKHLAKDFLNRDFDFNESRFRAELSPLNKAGFNNLGERFNEDGIDSGPFGSRRVRPGSESGAGSDNESFLGDFPKHKWQPSDGIDALLYPEVHDIDYFRDLLNYRFDPTSKPNPTFNQYFNRGPSGSDGEVRLGVVHGHQWRARSSDGSVQWPSYIEQWRDDYTRPAQSEGTTLQFPTFDPDQSKWFKNVTIPDDLLEYTPFDPVVRIWEQVAEQRREFARREEEELERLIRAAGFGIELDEFKRTGVLTSNLHTWITNFWAEQQRRRDIAIQAATTPIGKLGGISEVFGDDGEIAGIRVDGELLFDADDSDGGDTAAIEHAKDYWRDQIRERLNENFNRRAD